MFFQHPAFKNTSLIAPDGIIEGGIDEDVFFSFFGDGLGGLILRWFYRFRLCGRERGYFGFNLRRSRLLHLLDRLCRLFWWRRFFDEEYLIENQNQE
jgi:hypothetical protein